MNTKTGIPAIQNLKFLLIIALVSGCSGPPMASVSGTAQTEDGISVAEGVLILAPIDEGNPNPGKPASANIKDGTFVLSTNGPDDGALVGRHRVKLSRAKLKNKLDCELKSEFSEVEIVDGENKLNLIVSAIQRRRSDKGDDDDDPEDQ